LQCPSFRVGKRENAPTHVPYSWKGRAGALRHLLRFESTFDAYQKRTSPTAFNPVIPPMLSPFYFGNKSPHSVSPRVAPTVRILSRPLGECRPRGHLSFLFLDLGSNIYLLTYSHLQKSSLLASAFFVRSVSSVIPLRSLFSDIPPFQAAKDVSTSQDKLVEPFNRIGHFFRWLEIYSGVSPTTTITDIIVETMVKVMTILGIAAKEIHRGQLSELFSHVHFTIR